MNRSSTRTKKIILGLVVLVGGLALVVAPLGSRAAATPTSPTAGGIVNCQSALPGTTPGAGELPSCDLCQLVSMINTIFNYATAFLGGAAVLMIIVGGIMYVTAAGSQELIIKAKKTLQFAIIGLVVVVLSFVIVQTILKILAPDKNFFGSIDCKIDKIIPTSFEASFGAQAKIIIVSDHQSRPERALALT